MHDMLRAHDLASGKGSVQDGFTGRIRTTVEELVESRIRFDEIDPFGLQDHVPHRAELVPRAQSLVLNPASLAVQPAENT